MCYEKGIVNPKRGQEKTILKKIFKNQYISIVVFEESMLFLALRLALLSTKHPTFQVTGYLLGY